LHGYSVCRLTEVALKLLHQNCRLPFKTGVKHIALPAKKKSTGLAKRSTVAAAPTLQPFGDGKDELWLAVVRRNRVHVWKTA